jgi:solute carrier family 25 thiamine pyrophosphate transporter 19
MAAGDQYLLLLLLLQGLWQGTVPGMLLTIPYTAVQFVALQQCKDAAAKLGWEGV